eukprot:1157961-Pelagomonas_calceolata.AAC.2
MMPHSPLPSMQSLDVIATRLFFDRHVPTKYPANVLSGFEPAAGATFFNLNELQAYVIRGQSSSARL